MVAAVGLVMLFWAVIRVFGSIENAFNNIWEVKVERSIARQWTDYIAVVMIVPVLWILANRRRHRLRRTAAGIRRQLVLRPALAARLDGRHLDDVHPALPDHPQRPRAARAP